MVWNGVLFVMCFLVLRWIFLWTFFLKSLPISKVDCFHVPSSQHTTSNWACHARFWSMVGRYQVQNVVIKHLRQPPKNSTLKTWKGPYWNFLEREYIQTTIFWGGSSLPAVRFRDVVPFPCGCLVSESEVPTTKSVIFGALQLHPGGLIARGDGNGRPTPAPHPRVASNLFLTPPPPPKKKILNETLGNIFSNFQVWIWIRYEKFIIMWITDTK